MHGISMRHDLHVIASVKDLHNELGGKEILTRGDPVVHVAF